MYHRLDDTIAAVASAPGGAARGVVRISGPSAVSCLEAVFTAESGLLLRNVYSPQAIAGCCRLQACEAALPCTLYLWPGSRSYTRQPLAELHTFGSPPLVEALLQLLYTSGVRLAERGEFTLRAFLAGRIDLTQAEAVIGVIDAAGGPQLNAALTQLAGGLSGPLHVLRGDLLDLLADLEAGLDFIEEDIEFVSRQEMGRRLADAERHVEQVLAQMTQRQSQGDEPVVVLVGLPNAGKSSLLNALAGQAAAIVSPQAGTTRDYVMRRVECDGMTCLVVDTAGVEAATQAGSIIAQAQQHTGEQSQRAELQVLCIDAAQGLSQIERDQLPLTSQTRITVLTKADLPHPTSREHGVIATSSVTGQGLAELKRTIAAKLANTAHDCSRVVAATAARCRSSLAQARASLQSAQELAAAGEGEELIAAQLRAALNELGQVVGVVYTDDILDRIFSRFCIGK